MPQKRPKKRTRRRNIIIGIVVLLALAATAMAAGWLKKDKEIPVTIAKATMRNIVEKVSASGTIQPEKEVKISPDVPGEIIELNVKEGDSVEAGKLLIKLEPDNFEAGLSRSEAVLNQSQANYAEAQARLARAKAQLVQLKNAFERNKGLYEDKVIAAADFEQSQANYEVGQQDLVSAQQSAEAARFAVKSARASVDEARENLSRTSVYAPVSGIVSRLSVEQGERVVGTSQMAGTEMLRIADLSQMEVRVDVNENDIIRIAMGDTAIIDVDAYSHMEKTFTGVVTAIANSANDNVSPEAVTEFEVRIRLLNESYQDLITAGSQYPFRPGMTASVEIITNRKDNVLAVPLSSVTTRQVTTDTTTTASTLKDDNLAEVVFTFNAGIANRKEVKTGISDFDFIEILEGISSGEEIISGPFLSVSKELEDGSKVKADNQVKAKVP